MSLTTHADADDIDLFTRRIGRKLKFCPVDGVMITKSDKRERG